MLDYIDNVLDAEDSTSKKKAQASGTKSGDALEQSICNFQLASNTLDTSVKIYAYRVDAVHTDAYKVLGGLNRTEVSSRVKEALADDDHDDEDEDGQRSKKAQRQRKVSHHCLPFAFRLPLLTAIDCLTGEHFGVQCGQHQHQGTGY